MKEATSKQTKEFVSSLEETQLRCRTFSHQWDVSSITHESRNVFVMTLWCPCGATRIDTISNRGQVLHRRIDYSGTPGYLSKFGRPKDGKAAFRKEKIARLIERAKEV